ncbi:hypothetical protein [Streptomyces sp. NPDC001985]|uniref:hypothetical protein n=1 Tax=Streptomyces sp. NPDC001985 TaxID=3154406 RepID=UPI0033303494
MDHSTAKIVRILGLVILGLTLVMAISVIALLAAGAEFTLIMTAPIIFLGIGLLIFRTGSGSAKIQKD